MPYLKHIQEELVLTAAVELTIPREHSHPKQGTISVRNSEKKKKNRTNTSFHLKYNFWSDDLSIGQVAKAQFVLLTPQVPHFTVFYAFGKILPGYDENAAQFGAASHSL